MNKNSWFSRVLRCPRLHAVSISLLCVISVAALAVETQYVHDEAGRLVQASRSDGPVVQYRYDANGNLTNIERFNAGGLGIATFAPSITHATATVVISGTGFSAVPAENAVSVGGASAIVTAASAKELTISVPGNAQSGVITVTVGGSTATSSQSIVIRRPSILDFSPKVVAANSTVSVSGAYLNLIPGSTSFTAGSHPATVSTLTNSAANIIVPASASGRIRVQTAYGEGVSAQELFVLPSGVSVSSVDSTGTVALGGNATSLNITGGSRSAVLAFDATAGQRLSLQLDSYAATPSNSSLPYKFYSPTGSLLRTATLHNDAKTAHLPTIASDGRHLVVFTTPAGNAISFSARLEEVGMLNLDGGTQVVSTTVAGQSKQYRFSANAGDTLSLATFGVVTNPTSVSNVTVTVTNPSGSQIAFTRGYRTHSPGDSTPLIDLPTTGLYAVYVAPDGLATMDLNLRVVRPIAGTLIAGTPGSTLPVPLAINGDIGWYSFAANAGEILALNLDSIVSTPANRTIWFQIFDPDKNQISSSGGVDTSKTINFSAATAGTYYALVNPGSAEITSANLKLAEGVTGTLPTDGTVTPVATWVRGQNAYFSFDATAGQDLSFATTGMALTPASGSLAVTIKRPSGSQHYFGNHSRTANPGTYVSLMDLPATGTYTVTLAPSAHTQSALNLRIAPMIGGTIVPGDPAQALTLPVQGDSALLEFTIGEPRNVTVNATSIVTVPSSKTVRVYVYNAAGTLVGNNSGTGSTRTVNMTNLPAGTYRVHISLPDAATATMQVGIP